MGKPDKGIEHEAPLMVSVRCELHKHWDCLAGPIKEVLIFLNAYALITDRLGRSER